MIARLHHDDVETLIELADGAIANAALPCQREQLEWVRDQLAKLKASGEPEFVVKAATNFN